MKKEDTPLVIGFKRLSWLGTFFFAALAGLIVAFYNEPAYGFAAAFITGIIVFPVFRFLVVWIVKGFASGKSAEKRSGLVTGESEYRLTFSPFVYNYSPRNCRTCRCCRIIHG